MGEEEKRQWGGIIDEARLEQLERRESDCNLPYIDDTKNRPRRMYAGEGGLYFMDHVGEFWVELSNNKVEKEDYISANFEEINKLYSHDIYEEGQLTVHREEANKGAVD